MYFQQAKNAEKISEDAMVKALTIQPGDVLAINISSQIPEATEAYQLNVGVESFNSPSIINDFLVDEDGFIDFPIIGRLKVGGLTIKQIREKFVERLSDDLRDPIINIRLINFTIVVLGEVRRPSTYMTGRQQVTVFQALGLAGDLTEQADRDKVIIIREVDGKRVTETLNLSSAAIIESDYYYLRQNDMLYVPPAKRKSFSVSSQPYSQVILPVVGVLLTIASLAITISNR